MIGQRRPVACTHNVPAAPDYWLDGDRLDAGCADGAVTIVDRSH